VIAVRTSVSRRPLPDPYAKNYFIRLLPWVTDAKPLTLAHIPCQVRSMLPPVSEYRSQTTCQNFPLVTGLPSRTSAMTYDHIMLFGSFSGTTPMSDFSAAYMSGLRPQAFPYRPAATYSAGTAEISRFSNIEHPHMHRVLDSVEPDNS